MYHPNAFRRTVKFIFMVLLTGLLSACVLESEKPLFKEEAVDVSGKTPPDLTGDYYFCAAEGCEKRVVQVRRKANTANAYTAMNAKGDPVSLIVIPLKEPNTLLLQLEEKGKGVLLVPARITSKGLEVFLIIGNYSETWKGIAKKYALPLDSKLIVLQEGANKASVLAAIEEMFEKDGFAKGELFKRVAPSSNEPV